MYFGCHYLQDNSANVYAIDRFNGQERWLYKCLYLLSYVPTNVFVAKGRLYFGCSDGNVHAINTTTGQAAWVHEVFVSHAEADAIVLSSGFSGSLDYDLEHDVVFVSTMRNYTVALDARTGREIWRFTVKLASPTGLSEYICTRQASKLLSSICLLCLLDKCTHIQHGIMDSLAHTILALPCCLDIPMQCTHPLQRGLWCANSVKLHQGLLLTIHNYVTGDVNPTTAAMYDLKTAVFGVNASTGKEVWMRPLQPLVSTVSDLALVRSGGHTLLVLSDMDGGLQVRWAWLLPLLHSADGIQVWQSLNVTGCLYEHS